MRLLLTGMIAAALLLAACATTDVTTSSPPLERGAKWALLPMVNHTDVPQAGLRAEAITEALLRSLGVAELARYPVNLNPDAVFEPAERKVADAAQKWAKESGARYAVSGAVDEWRYKVGIDGEPAVGVALQITDLQSGAVVWSGVGAKSGWSREALAAVAQKLVRDLLSTAKIR
jgi:TolB-like protein